jgi:hypothetical protein
MPGGRHQIGIPAGFLSECLAGFLGIARSRELGYRELTLWTNDILVAARCIYQAAGFRFVSEAPYHSFGHDLVGQTWTLDLG